MSISIDDMKSCVQEWFAEAMTVEDLREIYFQTRQEIDRQFGYMFDIMSEERKENKK